MRPLTPSRSASPHYDDIPQDLAFDVPASGDYASDAPSLAGVDVFPDSAVDTLPEAHREGAGRAKKSPKTRPYFMAEPSAPAVVARPEGPASVCLACGASPPEGGECPHDEVAHLADAPPALMAVVRKLQAAVQERYAQERALRRLVAAEVSSGRGDLETPNRVAHAASHPVEREAPCAQCGHRPVLSRAARRKALREAQACFAFATPPVPPERVPEAPHAPAEEAVEAAPEKLPAKRGRPRKAAPQAPAAEAAATPSGDAPVAFLDM
jgi:hypothetical protein